MVINFYASIFTRLHCLFYCFNKIFPSFVSQLNLQVSCIPKFYIVFFFCVNDRIKFLFNSIIWSFSNSIPITFLVILLIIAYVYLLLLYFLVRLLQFICITVLCILKHLFVFVKCFSNIFYYNISISSLFGNINEKDFIDYVK